MKKFLSLVLALVMTMSLVTISAGAKDFTDDSKITYEEAVDVISAVKVVDGYTDGSFNPTATLTRGAAAKIICNLILGPTTASALVADTAPYSDVSTSNTFAGYIAYCSQQKIISGYADGTFRPGATLTSYAFMKMLLGALGYDSDVEGYVGNNWSINVAKQALAIDLDDGLEGEFNGVKAVTREEACLYAFNTLKATMVEYDSTTTVNVNGATVTVGGSKAKDVTTGNIDGLDCCDDDTLQFAEKYFTNLKGITTSDDFGRPATTWKVKSTEVGTYAETPDQSYTEKVKGKDIYKDLDKGEIEAADITYFVDGVETDLPGDFAIAKNNDNKKVGGQGSLTEVFFDEDDETVVITVINTYLAQVSGDYDEDDEELDIQLADDSDTPEGSVDYTLSIDDLANLDEFEDEDYVLITVASDNGEASGQYVYSIDKAEKVTATVTAYTKEDSVKAGGEKYSYNATYAGGDGPADYAIKEDYDLYLDFYGNVIWADGVDADDDVVYISEVVKDGKLTSSKVKAAAIFLDGTYQEITLNKDPDGNKYKDYSDDELAAVEGWYEFKEKSDGTYDLKKDHSAVLEATDAGEKVTEKDSIYVAGVRANAKTQFVVTDAVDESGKAYTGIKNAPAITNKDDGDAAEVAIVMDGNYAKYVLIVLNDAKDKSTSKSDDLIYILEGEPSDETVNEDEDTIYTYKAIVNGKVTKVDIHEDADNADALAVGLYEDIVYEDDVVTDLTKVEADADTFADCEDYTIEAYLADVKITQKGSVVTFADEGETVETGDGYYLASGAKIFVITKDEDGDYDETKSVTAKKLVADYNGLACTVTGVLKDGEFTTLFVDLDA